MKRKWVTIYRCGSCIYFVRPPPNENWGWCSAKNIQRTKDQSKCDLYKRLWR